MRSMCSKCAAAGQANKQIARGLSLSEDTVKGHLRSIFAKLDVTDRTQAVTVAHRRGIIASRSWSRAGAKAATSPWGLLAELARAGGSGFPSTCKRARR
ncbi:response regulator transcription factor [Caulobacter segnis]